MPANPDWRERWQSGNTPWSYPEANRELEEDYDDIGRQDVRPGDAVFVPLCGDSRAVRFLWERGHNVSALEFVPEALARLRRDVFPELSFTRHEKDGFIVYAAERLQLFEGDIFHFQAPERFRLIYDRAALVALPQAKRAAYAEVLSGSAAPGSFLFLITYEYESAAEQQPPYSVSKAEVRKLFSGFDEDAYREEVLTVTPPHMASYSKEPPQRVRYILRKRPGG